MSQENEIKEAVRTRYAEIALRTESCCSEPSDRVRIAERAKAMGYLEEELRTVPEGALMGLGCGNPSALALLKTGETVLDLGAGEGLDVFLAAQKVGERGKVIGVDMTPEMVRKAREHATQGGFGNVEFRLGEIEHLPIADDSIDVIIVVNQQKWDRSGPEKIIVMKS